MILARGSRELELSSEADQVVESYEAEADELVESHGATELELREAEVQGGRRAFDVHFRNAVLAP